MLFPSRKASHANSRCSVTIRLQGRYVARKQLPQTSKKKRLSVRYQRRKQPPEALFVFGLCCPTWPEQALRANIHCQISLALNRIYTEWYPSKGYTFNITNSTSYDQY